MHACHEVAPGGRVDSLGAEDRVRHKVGGIAGDRRCDVGVEVKRYSDGGVSESF